MPITKDVNNVVTNTPLADTWEFALTGNIPGSQFTITGQNDALKQVQISAESLPTNTRVILQAPATSGTIALAGQTGGNGFTTMQTPAGTSPVATGSMDTLTLVGDQGITITGNAGTDTITFAGRTIDVQIFSSVGTSTWNKPDWARTTRVFLLGAGGGGGSGRKGASGTVRCGGGGGAPGGLVIMDLYTDLLGNTETVTVGAAGTGAAGQGGDSKDGKTGTAGGNTTFGTHALAPGGLPGSGGGVSGGPGGAAQLTSASPINHIQTAGGSASASGGNAGATANVTIFPTPSGGGAGGGIDSADVQGNAAAGGDVIPILVPEINLPGGGPGGTGAGNPGTNSGALPQYYGKFIGSGGGGSPGIPAGASSPGGGGADGAGGGGSGAALDGSSGSGPGGDGGRGWCVVVSW